MLGSAFFYARTACWDIMAKSWKTVVNRRHFCSYIMEMTIIILYNLYMMRKDCLVAHKIVRDGGNA